MQTLVSNESLIVGLIWRCKAPTISRFNTLYNCDMLSSPIIDFSSFAFLTNLHYRFCGRSLNSSGTFLFFFISWWLHQMETFSALLAICAGNSPVTGEFPAQRPVTRSFDVFFDLRLNKGWINNVEAGDLRRHRAHYDVIVMLTKKSQCRN